MVGVQGATRARPAAVAGAAGPRLSSTSRSRCSRTASTISTSVLPAQGQPHLDRALQVTWVTWAATPSSSTASRGTSWSLSAEPRVAGPEGSVVLRSGLVDPITVGRQEEVSTTRGRASLSIQPRLAQVRLCQGPVVQEVLQGATDSKVGMTPLPTPPSSGTPISSLVGPAEPRRPCRAEVEAGEARANLGSGAQAETADLDSAAPVGDHQVVPQVREAGEAVAAVRRVRLRRALRAATVWQVFAKSSTRSSDAFSRHHDCPPGGDRSMFVTVQ